MIAVIQEKTHGVTRACGVLSLVALLVGCPTEQTPTPPPPTPPAPPPPAAQTIGSSGGTLRFQNGQVTMQFPAGAVASDTAIGIVPISTLPVDGVPGTVYEFSPDGIQFAKPVRLTVKYDPAQIPSGTLETQLSLANIKPDGWQPLETSGDAGANTLSADLNGFSGYGAVPTVRAWLFGASGSGSDVSTSGIAADNNGGVYVIGSSDAYGGTATDGNRAFVTGFTRDGTTRSGWPVRVALPSGYGQSSLQGVAVDTGGNSVCATGTVTKNATPNAIQGLIVCFNSAGVVRNGYPVLLPEGVEATGIAVDTQLNAYVTGFTKSALEVGKPYFGGDADVFVTSYTASGQLRSGWPRQFGTNQFDAVNPQAIALDGSSNVLLAWSAFNTPNNPVYLESLTSDGVRRSGYPQEFHKGTSGENFLGMVAPGAITWRNNAINTGTGAQSVVGFTASPSWPKPLEVAVPQTLGFVEGIAVDVQRNVYVVAKLDPGIADNPSDVWLTSFTPEGARRSGYPKILGSDLEDAPSSGIAVSAVGDVFIAGSTKGNFQGLTGGAGVSRPFVARVRGD
jgi:hypothetical protein